jgi:hypothetical protein
VQLKRHEALQEARNRDRLEKMKEDRRIRREIGKIARGEYGVSLPAVGKPSSPAT